MGHCYFSSSRTEQIRRDIAGLREDFAKVDGKSQKKQAQLEARMDKLEQKLDRLIDLLEPKQNTKKLLGAGKAGV